ncbi:hypothetical protein FisN_3Hh453 [Fistulifera solaris]|uniref:Alternative oxidase n=1 Tax=Fistulifera solaris TaxID=1519565 RepID=A0A1Z5K886_FISSO|nr:hypothetical protein FisN_3Hh453 [Fistulifera solaris]|eukprot:GAX22341.1 hypothetical protein FisN_3Hh453 [Fistulifera solaris]
MIFKQHVTRVTWVLLLLWRGAAPFTPTLAGIRRDASSILKSSSTADNSDTKDDMLNGHRQVVKTIKSILFDNLYAGTTLDRSYARFYALETIARMPYFAYTSVLHFLETTGKWRQADRLALHFAETWNELHHLLIMEELLTQSKNPTQDQIPFRDRFVAQHVAFFYFWFAVGLYLVRPDAAYSLNQAVEEEAYATYDAFLKEREDYLKSQPAPEVAINYYNGSGQDMFDRMSKALAIGKIDCATSSRRVECKTLYDCFVAIRDDELEHSQTMELLKREPFELDQS